MLASRSTLLDEFQASEISCFKKARWMVQRTPRPLTPTYMSHTLLSGHTHTYTHADKKIRTQAPWFTPVSSALRKLKQEVAIV